MLELKKNKLTVANRCLTERINVLFDANTDGIQGTISGTYESNGA